MEFYILLLVKLPYLGVYLLFLFTLPEVSGWRVSILCKKSVYSEYFSDFIHKACVEHLSHLVSCEQRICFYFLGCIIDYV